MSLVKVVRDGYDADTVSGQGWSLSPVNDFDRAPALRAKLMEEVAEYLEDRTPGELADILEVVFGLAALEGISVVRLLLMAEQKRERKGGFARVLGLYLDPPEGLR